LKLEKHIILIISIAAFLFALYCYDPFLLYFLNDDFVHIPLSKNAELLQHNSFRPLCDLSIQLDYTIWGRQAWGYHLTNLLLHAVNTAMVYYCCMVFFKRYGFQKIKLISTLSGIIFFIYANHSEAVFWILGRSAMLGMFFFLPAMIFYAKRNSNRAFAWMILFSWLAWCSYESAWIIVLIASLISLADYKAGLSTLKKEVAKLVILAANFFIYLLVRFYFIQEIVSDYEAGAFLQKDYTLLAGNYARLMIRSWLPYADNSGLLIIIFLMIVAGMGMLIFFQKDKNIKTIYLFFITAWLISLLPYISLGIDTRGTESERFLYLPSVFVSSIIAFILLNIKRGTYRYICFATVVFIQLILLNKNAKHYRYAGSITKKFTDILQTFPAQSKLYADSVPQECNGALIYRLGFAESIKWLGNNDSLIHFSPKKNNLILQKKYALMEVKNIDEIPGNNLLQPLPGNTIYIRFTDSVLWVCPGVGKLYK
jgi:hypothetical protein